jgi:hypothetical protein
MDNWNGDHTVSRQHQQELLQEAENRRLARALCESRKVGHEDTGGRKVLRLAAILARALHKV